MPNAWANHPMAQNLIRFNALPSLNLHASRLAKLMPLGVLSEISPALWNRHCSAILLQSLDSQPVLTLEDPALPLAMLPAPMFERLTLWSGVLLVAPWIQRTIARADVLELNSQLGAEAVNFALNTAPGLLKLSSPPQADFLFAADQSRAQALQLGSALLSAAFATAPPGIAQRGLLRLPADVVDIRAKIATTVLKNDAQALLLARSMTHLLEPAWLSSFPTQH